jgi:uncharacterized protein YciI
MATNERLNAPGSGGGAPAPSYFMFRLLPPRSTFPFDITDEERRVMADHAAYLKTLLDEGVLVAAGPVHDPKGVWGFALLEVDDPARVDPIQSNDPAVRSGLGFRYEVFPLLSAMVRPLAKPAGG